MANLVEDDDIRGDLMDKVVSSLSKLDAIYPLVSSVL